MLIADALQVLSSSLKQDRRVQAIFVKGSVGRGEHDEHSDLDLYCLVDEKDLDGFLDSRIDHLESYGKLLFHDDIFIIAPQILAVYKNMLHVDLFAVTEKTFIEKDFFKVIYDPDELLSKFVASQNLRLSEREFQDAVDDIAWFLFQYKKATARGNDLWSVNMLNHVMTHLVRVLLYRYKPERAQLGLKTAEASLPEDIVHIVQKIQENLTPKKHLNAAIELRELLNREADWIFSKLSNPAKIKPLWDKLITT
ncbi:nucleotidyltransferase domain-containing protein [Mesobacillus selenatarsenatis]|uniref:Nucleotidyltransferase domain-containing protein n=1 Tax=Mesobacillus selenatarsenatis TaxID=388741 RepID=A0A846TEN8_9BACI|nr:nucleotidyltransferase domain-containing protein [Mesobacillus selenatarsenatis]NKE03887.1 nucleotidyltransferase domain-containing protein [Mesobacillus selenatarsenatis]